MSKKVVRMHRDLRILFRIARVRSTKQFVYLSQRESNMNQTKKTKKWVCTTVAGFLGSLLLVAGLMVLFDPYFHYHGPIKGLSYRLYEERYINDGISRHFSFDTLITGTSMAQNFKPSEAEALFGGKAVKETFSGAGFQETSSNIDRALRRNPQLKRVIWSFEYNGFFRPYDWAGYENYPEYLYDDIPWNDMSYLYNKAIFYHGFINNLVMTLTGQESTSMDEYSAWEKETGLEHILTMYDRNNVQHNLPSELTETEAEMVAKNIQENMVNLFQKYPDTTFYLFYTPYSICFWDSLIQMDTLERQFQAEQLGTEMLLNCPNVKLFNFFDQYDVITDVNNYRDKEHYAAWINTKILQWMASDTGLVTKENYLERLEAEKQFYRNYDYDAIYQ